MAIEKPQPDTYPAFYHTYVNEVPENDLLQALHNNRQAIEPLMLQAMDKGNYRYAEGKWSIKEVLMHIIDAERIFAYRALTFARGDKNALPGFDEDAYVNYYSADKRTLQHIYGELIAVRNTTMFLFQSFDEEALQRSGIANGNAISVSALGFVIAGHANHHFKVIKERYL